MKSTSSILGLIGIGILAPLMARADFITLKSGEKIEGKIISENADSMQVEYHLTPKIKDSKTILKSAIAEVIRQTPAEIEFKERELGKILPTADLMTAREYEAIIQDKLRTFVAKNPETPEAQEAEKMIAQLADEKSKVLSGQIKMEGKWIDAATAKRDSYNIEAYRLHLQMNAKATSRHELRYLLALRDFDKLRTDFGASPHFVLAINDALGILKKFESQLTVMITEAPIMIQKRQNGLKSLVGNDLNVTMQAIAKEEANFKAALDQQMKDKVKWLEISKYDDKSLQDALATVHKEMSELHSIDVAGLQQENDTLTSMIRYIADGNATEAKVIYDKISKLPGLINKTVVQSFGSKITEMEKVALLEQKNAVKNPTTSTTPTTTEPTNESLATNPVAETMKKLQADKEKEAAEKAKKDAADAAAKTAAAKKTPPPVEEPSGIMSTIMDNIPLVGAVVLAIGGLIWMVKRKKKEA